MTMQTASTPIPPQDGGDPSKRRQIMAGAREVFLAMGYDGASMDRIAKAANVSKGTLYVYFENKESLFEALILEERAALAENLFETGGNVADLRPFLTALGLRYLDAMVRPEHISSIRMVTGAVEKFPDFGRIFFAAGPQCGIDRLAALFRKAIAAGTLRDCDVEMAASHFMDLCGSGLIKRVLFNVEPEPSRERREKVVAAAVDVFLRAYGA